MAGPSGALLAGPHLGPRDSWLVAWSTSAPPLPARDSDCAVHGYANSLWTRRRGRAFTSPRCFPGLTAAESLSLKRDRCRGLGFRPRHRGGKTPTQSAGRRAFDNRSLSSHHGARRGKRSSVKLVSDRSPCDFGPQRLGLGRSPTAQGAGFRRAVFGARPVPACALNSKIFPANRISPTERAAAAQNRRRGF